ncbi:MAG: polyphenol oxidase family protein [Solirubrobacteraceae bacterium]|nr:polyphenol oxidase family protein [Solirubrobacteraceae bacterium]MDP4673497.1 polyphenol oxidase family protein [Solirubrobacteraceae bacterium]MDP4921506.1 polyphenol oxidase family protein [Solirubrobacteraceae bacterium]
MSSLGGSPRPSFKAGELGLRLTIGRTEMLFSSAAAGDFAVPSEQAIEALEALSHIDRDHWAQDEQVHGSSVNVVRAGSKPEPRTGPADAQVSDRDDLLCAVRTADCLALLITGSKAFGAVHAGWRGLSEGVIGAAVAEIRALDEGPLAAAIGPGARECCYEVGGDLLDTFSQYPAAQTEPGRLDLALIAREQLLNLGIVDIYDCAICTICSRRDEFFSYRRDDGETGRMIGAIWLN